MGWAEGWNAAERTISNRKAREQDTFNRVMEMQQKAQEYNTSMQQKSSSAASNARLMAQKYLSRKDIPEGLDSQMVASAIYEELMSGGDMDLINNQIKDGELSFSPRLQQAAEQAQKKQDRQVTEEATDDLTSQTDQALGQEPSGSQAAQAPASGSQSTQQAVSLFPKIASGRFNRRDQNAFNKAVRQMANEQGISVEDAIESLKYATMPGTEEVFPNTTPAQMQPGIGNAELVDPETLRDLQIIKKDIGGPDEKALAEYNSGLAGMKQTAQYMSQAYKLGKETPAVFSGETAAAANLWERLSRFAETAPDLLYAQDPQGVDNRIQQLRTETQALEQQYINSSGTEKIDNAGRLYNSMLELTTYELGRSKGQEGRALSNEERNLLKTAITTRNPQALLETMNQIIGSEMGKLESMGQDLAKSNVDIENWNNLLEDRVKDPLALKVLRMKPGDYNPWNKFIESDDPVFLEFINDAGLTGPNQSIRQDTPQQTPQQQEEQLPPGIPQGSVIVGETDAGVPVYKTPDGKMMVP